MMVRLKTLRALGAVDALSVSRDSLLRGMLVVPLGLAMAARWLFPPALASAGALLPFDLQVLYPQVMGYALLLLAPAICGGVVGFILLDQRDDGTLAALQVTPLPLTAYLAYRLAAPMLLSLVMTLIGLPLSGLVALGPLQLLLLALSAAPLAPLIALFLGAYAANKVQGFALQKGMGCCSSPHSSARSCPCRGSCSPASCRPTGRPRCSGSCRPERRMPGSCWRRGWPTRACC
jgi:fluoroquinolone transport system permease protein